MSAGKMMKFLSFCLVALVPNCLAQKEDSRVTKYLNWYRYNHEANGVKWDSGLTYKAYEATNAMCARGFDHHPGTEAEYGSLWAHSNRCEDVSGGALVTALQSWYSECPLYTGESSWQISGHFTQMVWRKSTKYGMWAQSCSSPD